MKHLKGTQQEVGVMVDTDTVDTADMADTADTATINVIGVTSTQVHQLVSTLKARPISFSTVSRLHVHRTLTSVIQITLLHQARVDLDRSQDLV